MLLHAHYRTQLNFTFATLDGVGTTFERIASFVTRLEEVKQTKSGHVVGSVIDKTREAFKAALADDLNISVALAALFDMLREVNGLIDKDQVSEAEAKQVLAFLEELDAVLGCLPLKKEEMHIPHEVQEAFENRQKARAEKNWKAADEYRDFILSKGYLIEDTPNGARIKKA